VHLNCLSDAPRHLCEPLLREIVGSARAVCDRRRRYGEIGESDRRSVCAKGRFGGRVRARTHSRTYTHTHKHKNTHIHTLQHHTKGLLGLAITKRKTTFAHWSAYTVVVICVHARRHTRVIYIIYDVYI